MDPAEKGGREKDPGLGGPLGLGFVWLFVCLISVGRFVLVVFIFSDSDIMSSEESADPGMDRSDDDPSDEDWVLEDSDDDPTPKISDEDMERYEKQVEESDGFDIDYFPGMDKVLEIIRPLDSQRHEFHAPYLKAAIKLYNKRQKVGGRLIELERIIKINRQAYLIPSIYYTFEARDVPGGTTRTYQGRVDLLPVEGDDDFILLREKTSSDVEGVCVRGLSRC